VVSLMICSSGGVNCLLGFVRCYVNAGTTVDSRPSFTSVNSTLMTFALSRCTKVSQWMDLRLGERACQLRCSSNGAFHEAVHSG
jgi:hypothetical protein